jgi:hypothetical protein
MDLRYQEEQIIKRRSSSSTTASTVTLTGAAEEAVKEAITTTVEIKTLNEKTTAPQKDKQSDAMRSRKEADLVEEEKREERVLECSTSMLDLLTLVFRYKATCMHIMQQIIPSSSIGLSDINMQQLKLFQARLTSLNNVYTHLFKFVEVYSANLLALDMCATARGLLVRLFSPALITEQTNSSDTLIWGCRHKLRAAPVTDCHHFIDRMSKLIADRYEPVDAGMCVRVNCAEQLKAVRAYLLAAYHRDVEQRAYTQLLALLGQSNNNNNSRATLLLLFQQLRQDVYRMKVVNRAMEVRLSAHSSGILALLVYRVKIEIYFCKI